LKGGGDLHKMQASRRRPWGGGPCGSGGGHGVEVAMVGRPWRPRRAGRHGVAAEAQHEFYTHLRSYAPFTDRPYVRGDS